MRTYRRLFAALAAVAVLAGCAPSGDPSPTAGGSSATTDQPGASTRAAPMGAEATTPGQPDNSAERPNPPDARSTVTMVRSGGFAGVRETIVVRPDGDWTRTDRTGAQRTGKLAADQRAALRALLSDPRLPREAGNWIDRNGHSCADAFNYQLTIETLQIDYPDCPSDAAIPPVASRIVALIDSATR